MMHRAMMRHSTMRIGLIADLHGNPIALEAALAALEQEAVDQLVCLGDVAIFGPAPRAVVARLRQVGCPVVMGNTDAWALDPHPHPIRNADSERLNAIELWGAAQLDDTDRAFIRTFQPTIELAAGSELRLLCYHGSPRSFHEGLLATTPDEQLDAALAGCTATLLAGGHTHTQMVRRHGEKLLINPGSVGQPVERVAEGVRYPPWAEFAVVEVLPGGDSGGGAGYTLSVALRRIPVDVAEVVKLAYAGGMPHAEWWVGHWR